MQNERNRGLLNISQQEVFDLLKPGTNPEGFTKAVLILVSLILSPITLFGALIFYKRGYSRFMEGQYPRLYNLPPIVRVGMILGGIFIWIGLFLISKVMIYAVFGILGETAHRYPLSAIAFLACNVLFTILVFVWFNRWRAGIRNHLDEMDRYGSAKFATEEELSPYRNPEGFYIGLNTFYKKAGHLLSVAGTRAGKSVNLILQNLLQPYLFKMMSWVCIDPKGELAAISANVLRKAGRKVVILNPWNLLSLSNTGYNPLDILINDPLHLADDIQMIAESIVPSTKEGEDSHFQDRARTFISTLLLFLVTSAEKKDRHLGTLWSWLRLDHEKWCELLADMMTCDDENVGDIIKAGANEIASLMKNSEREYGSVMSTAQKCTDFVKSPSLRKSMQGSDDFTSAELASGNVVIFVCIPLDRLKSHNSWLRLVITSLMRCIIRNPKEEVCFLIDEAYAFGYHSEIDMALGAYAGFGIHVWSIFQSLVQIKKIYGDTWENFIGNCSVRHFFNLSDNFSTEYMEKFCGMLSVPTYDSKGNLSGASARPLITSDEFRRQSGETIYTIIDQLPPVRIQKFPYYEMNLPADPNPYFKKDEPK